MKEGNNKGLGEKGRRRKTISQREKKKEEDREERVNG